MILIEDVLTISKKELELQETFWSERKEVESIRNGGYCMGLKCDDDGALSITLSLDFRNGKDFGGNIIFYVESAYHFIKYNNESWVDEDGDWNGEKEWVADDFCTLADVLNPQKNYLVDDKLTIKVVGYVFSKEHAKDREIHPTLKALWERDDHDFTISVQKDGKLNTEVKVHKLILSSSSTVFDRMLQTDMKEKAENKVVIIDFDANVVQAAVEYFYDHDDFQNKDTDTLVGGFVFSEKYDIKGLMKKIEDVLVYRVYPDTICQIANASVMANSPYLKNFCIRCLTLYSKHGIAIANAENLEDELKKAINDA